MPGLVAPGICRYSVIGTYAGRAVANIIDMHIDQTGSLSDRQDAVADQAAIIVSAWVDNILPRVANNYTAQSVRWVDLNDEDGSVGETSTGTGTDFPASGAGTTTPMPGNVAFRINRQISATRGQRKGRMYLVGVPESSTDDASPNSVISSDITGMNTAMAAFKSDVEQSAGVVPPNYDSWITVVHTKRVEVSPGVFEIQYEGRSHVSALVCDPTLGSQRRRLRG